MRIILWEIVAIISSIGITTLLLYVWIKKKNFKIRFYEALKAVLLYEFVIFLILLGIKDALYYICFNPILNLIICLGSFLFSFLLFFLVIKRLGLLKSGASVLGIFLTLIITLNLFWYGFSYFASKFNLEANSYLHPTIGIKILEIALHTTSWDYILHPWAKLIICK